MKLRKILSFMLVLTIVFSTFLSSVTFKASAAGRSYYVDQVYGYDGWDGSQYLPFKTLAKLSSITFSPGDVIYLRSGCTWNENLQLHGNGVSGSPITLTKYGPGNKPLIKGGGFSNDPAGMAVVGGMNLSNWNINNIQVEIINTNGLKSNTNCSVGIEFAYTQTGSSNISIQDCYVYGQGYSYNTYGIRIISVSTTYHNGYINGLTIKNNSCSNVGWAGIMVTSWDSTNQQNMHTQAAYTNVVVDNNTVIYTGGFGTVIMNATTGQMNNNNVHHCGLYSGSGNTWGVCGIMVMFCRSIDIMSNEVSYQYDGNCKDPLTGQGYDAGGIDIDWSSESIRVFYNRLHDNYGPGIETMANYNCSISSNIIYGNLCLTTVGNGQISISAYTPDTDFITGVQNLIVDWNDITVNVQHTAAISTKKLSDGAWYNNTVNNNTIRFTGVANTYVYYLDPNASMSPFATCNYNYIYGQWNGWYGCYHLLWGQTTKAGWTASTGYDANTTLN